MSTKKKKGGAGALPVLDDHVEVLSQSEIRQFLYLTAMQTNRFTILVGPAQKSFRVPQGLLTQRSSVFEKMESTEQVIRLPEEDTSTFEHFFIWLHALEPCLSISSLNAVVDLAIFAQKYHVYYLKNQASDVIRTALIEERWNITPDTIAKVYKSVPAGTIIRQLCFLGFLASCNTSVRMTWYGQNVRYTKWETAFYDCPGLGWDYFKHIQTKEEEASTISSGGACRFHDHSDIPSWVCRNRTECPYPQGAPVNIPNLEEDEREKELAEEDAVPVEYAMPADVAVEEIAREELVVKESAVDYAVRADEPTVEYAMSVNAAMEEIAGEESVVEYAMTVDAAVEEIAGEELTVDYAVLAEEPAMDYAMPVEAAVALEDAAPEDAPVIVSENPDAMADDYRKSMLWSV